MIRKSILNLNYANTTKKSVIHDFLDRFTCAVNGYIDILWSKEIFSGAFVGGDILDQLDLPLTFSAKQSAAQTALHIVKSQRKKKKRTKPLFDGKSFELDQRFIVISEAKQSKEFDLWITFRGLAKTSGERLSIKVPTKRHKHFNSFLEDGWKLKKSLRIRRDGKSLEADIFFEKKEPEPKTTGKSVGLDCGYKKLAVLSTGQRIGKKLVAKCEKIARKKQNSKAFKRALAERNDYINREIKKINLCDVKDMVVEGLKNVKHKTKGKIRRKFMNKLQRWTYPYFLNRLAQACKVSGVQYFQVNPAYTSQRCNSCGSIHRENRNGELFRCVECGHTADADFNASLNILDRFLAGRKFGACVQK